jgi:hypothetical protein
VVLSLELLPGQSLDREHAWWSMRRQLEMYGFAGVMDVELKVVPKLGPDPKTGKFRRMVSLVGEPADLGANGARYRVDPGAEFANRPAAGTAIGTTSQVEP